MISSYFQTGYGVKFAMNTIEAYIIVSEHDHTKEHTYQVEFIK